VARHRQRAKGGHLVIPITIDWHVVDLLTEQGFLPTWSDFDRHAIRQALETALFQWAHYEA
jgi:hypothetical protein